MYALEQPLVEQVSRIFLYFFDFLGFLRYLSTFYSHYFVLDRNLYLLVYLFIVRNVNPQCRIMIL